MKGRISVLIALAVLALGISIQKILENSKDVETKKILSAPPKLVQVKEVIYDTVQTVIRSFGYLKARDQIQLFTEVSGVMLQTNPPFKQGSVFKKGQVLFRMDDTEAKFNLASMKSDLLNALVLIMADVKNDYQEEYPAWKAYVDDFDLKNKLKAIPEVKDQKLKYFLAGNNIYKLYYSIRRMEVQLDKYTIRAPFDGVLTTAGVEPGSLVRSMQPIGNFKGRGIYELELAVNMEDLDFISLGNYVNVFSNDREGSWRGRIIRINPNIDPGSQTIMVYVSITGENLKDGMYMNASIYGRNIVGSFQIPRNAIVNSNFVYLVNDSLLQLKGVEIIRMGNEMANIRGVEEGKLLVVEPLINISPELKVKPVVVK